MIYEGEYFNGKKHGKRKEYNQYNQNENLIFEGEYLNEWRWTGKEYCGNCDKLHLKIEKIYLKGRSNAKVKEYFSNGKLKFEGEYLNGKIWNGKGYNSEGEIDFEIKEGKGNNIKDYNKYDEIIFEGEYFNGKRNGKGKGKEYEIWYNYFWTRMFKRLKMERKRKNISW